jgi:hypothetical protein
MRASTAEIQRLAERVVEAMLKQGYTKAAVEKAVLARRIVELIQKNLDEEAALEADAERMADQHARQMGGMDQRRVIDLIKKKLAEERGFTL